MRGESIMSQIMKCEFCGIEIDWEDCDGIHGHIWECENEECRKIFCSKCTEDVGGSVSCEEEKILCPECTKNKNYLNGMATMFKRVALSCGCTEEEINHSTNYNKHIKS